MFEKYNEKARRALFFARYEASKLGSRVIESEHILLGILREGEETVVELLERHEIKPDDLRREIEGERVFVERIAAVAADGSLRAWSAVALLPQPLYGHGAAASDSHIFVSIIRFANQPAERSRHRPRGRLLERVVRFLFQNIRHRLNPDKVGRG